MNETQIIEYYTIRNYGTDMMYIADIQVKDNIQRLLQCKTINQFQMNLLTKIFNVTWVEVLPPKETK